MRNEVSAGCSSELSTANIQYSTVCGRIKAYIKLADLINSDQIWQLLTVTMWMVMGVGRGLEVGGGGGGAGLGLELKQTILSLFTFSYVFRFHQVCENMQLLSRF